MVAITAASMGELANSYGRPWPIMNVAMADVTDGAMGAVIAESLSGHGRVHDGPWGAGMGGRGGSYLTAIVDSCR